MLSNADCIEISRLQKLIDLIRSKQRQYAKDLFLIELEVKQKRIIRGITERKVNPCGWGREEA